MVTMHSVALPGKQLTTVPGMTGVAMAKKFGVKPWWWINAELTDAIVDRMSQFGHQAWIEISYVSSSNIGLKHQLGLGRWLLYSEKCHPNLVLTVALEVS